MEFKQGALVFWNRDNGEEVVAEFRDYVYSQMGNAVAAKIQINGEIFKVYLEELLPPKMPGFNVRDVALVINETKQTVQGEIIAIGRGPTNKKFYELKFEGNIAKWYSEDEVFNLAEATKPLRISDKALERASERG